MPRYFYNNTDFSNWFFTANDILLWRFVRNLSGHNLNLINVSSKHHNQHKFIYKVVKELLVCWMWCCTYTCFITNTLIIVIRYGPTDRKGGTLPITIPRRALESSARPLIKLKKLKNIAARGLTTNSKQCHLPISIVLHLYIFVLNHVCIS